MTSQNVAARYNKLGGIDEFIERFGRGKGTLMSVAKAARVSRETIRNDIKRHIGNEGYARLVAKRREVLHAESPLRALDIDAAQRRLIAMERVADQETRREYQVIRAVLRQMKDAGVPLTFLPSRSSGFKYELPNGHRVQIRVAFVDESRKDHANGFYRFKVNPDVTRYSFVVFAVAKGREVLPFVFPSTDIKDIRSLNLRFIDESKYDIKRKSKYDYARKNWKPLTRVR
jgi:hypothetical protein